MSRPKRKKIKKILRNKLDFLLTDLLPVELPEIFSFRYLYEELLQKKNNASLQDWVKAMRESIGKNNSTPFEGWNAIPLNFDILKKGGAYRKMSIINPLSAINAYLFLEQYEDDLLISLEKNSVASLRYHVRNTNLFYDGTKESLIRYQDEAYKSIGKYIIEKSATYFSIVPFRMLSDFTRSNKWRRLNSKYKYFVHLDYKLCFDSIYSHIYNMLNTDSIADAKKMKNSNLFVAIDRLLQNINGSLSHGVIVGPEFSRLLVEILLQNIDIQLIDSLSAKGMQYGVEYEFYRYVDDIYLFVQHEHAQEIVLSKLEEIAARYRMNLNAMKTKRYICPVSLDLWYKSILDISRRLKQFFDDSTSSDKKVIPYKRELTDLVLSFDEYVSNYKENVKQGASYILSRMISLSSAHASIIKSAAPGFPCMLVYTALHLLSFSPTYDLYQRVISLIDFYLNVLKDKHKRRFLSALQNYIYDFEVIFERENYSDFLNFILFMRDNSLCFSQRIEVLLENRIFRDKNPLAIAIWFLYSEYDDKYYHHILSKVNTLLISEMKLYATSDFFLDVRFWFIAIFINCEKIDPAIIDTFRDMINTQHKKYEDSPKLNEPKLQLLNFLLRERKNVFFDWNYSTDVSSLISYRTYNRTIFGFKSSPYYFGY